MIKIFNADDKNYSTNGNIAIQPLKCIETKKEGFDGWYVELEIAIDYKEYIAHDNIIVVPTKSKGEQPFRIKNPEINSRGIRFTAHHVAFDSEDYILADIYPQGLNGMALLDWINTRTDNTSPFTVFSDVSNLGTARIVRKTLKDAFLIAQERIGGNFDFDGWTINLLSSIGLDRGETIRYGKNLQGIRVYENWGNVCTKLLAVGPDGIILPEVYLVSEVQYDKPYTKAISFDIPQKEGEELTNEEIILKLREIAIEYIETHQYPEISYEVEANINQSLNIGDIVYCVTKYVTVPTQVQGYVYDVNKKRVTKLVYGNYKRDVKAVFSTIKADIEKAVELGVTLNKVVADQSNLINQLGKLGHVYIDDNEIMVLDALPKEDAQNVLLINLGGIGFSSTGIEGPFTSAWTLNGAFNASFITTGILNASLLKAGMIQSPDGLSYWNLENGEIVLNVSSLKIQAKTVSTQEDIDSTLESAVGLIYADVESLETKITQNTNEIALRVAREELTAKNVWGINLISNDPVKWELIDSFTGQPVEYDELSPPTMQEAERYHLKPVSLIPVEAGRPYTLFSTLRDGQEAPTQMELVFYNIHDEIVYPQEDSSVNLFFNNSYIMYYEGEVMSYNSSYPATFVVPDDVVKMDITIIQRATGISYPIWDRAILNPEEISDSLLKLEIGYTSTDWIIAIDDVEGNHNLETRVEGEEPIDPEVGQLWLDSLNGADLNKWNGENWITIGWGNSENVLEKISAQEASLRVLEDSVNIKISSLEEGQEKVDTYFNFRESGMNIGKSDSPLNINISNQQMDFIDNGQAVAYINGQKMYITSANITNDLIIGVHQIERYNDEITFIKYVGLQTGGVG
ncbi:hypothetical protein GC105_11415 [Alkalibaculum sp. M08DMB]|uniref:Tail spike domain-containing protein n=1 Tax=Alkalibaculum sporogenes TaxID=2655001 RepID=A0A6A7KB27_9FIRM|nr:phage tail spike protein [Alkalibaculum sporogenes]MPW26397.1 hypothetical protein [Alkalibaculum sporogenes]